MRMQELQKRYGKMAVHWLLVLILGIAFLQGQCDGWPVEYNTKAGPVEGKLNIHLVPHTHNDLGWLKTLDQYYVGSNSSIQVAAVQHILDSVVAALQEDPNRKFIYVETGFFARWWREQHKKKKQIVRELVTSGQLEFINGGWCMHDEATTLYVDMIDQTSLGHRFLMKEFGILPRIGWQIDPFGHSAVQAYLLSAEVGFDALFFGRADYQDINNRRKHQTMEMIWRGSKSYGSSAEVFTGILPNLYSPPPGFVFDIQTTEAVIQDDPYLYDYNVEERIETIVHLAKKQAKEYKTNHIIWTMGEDFTYESAGTWFKQVDKIIHYANKDGRVNAFYSTPRIYVENKFAANITLPLKTDDFFPYADYSNAYWTGYFTSRPALKGYVRSLSGFLQAARQLEFLVGRDQVRHNTDSLEEALAILQHHDAVAGTSKQHVADDYARRLSQGHDEAKNVMNSALTCLISGKSNTSHTDTFSSERRSSSPMNDLKHQSGYASQSMDANETRRKKIELVQCPLLNISFCPESEKIFGDENNLVVAIYNPLGWKRNEVVRIPVRSSDLEVFDPSGSKVQTEIISIDLSIQRIRDLYTQDISHTEKPIYNLFFEVSVPALGYAVYIVKKVPDVSERSSVVVPENAHGNVSIHSGRIQMTFSDESGLLMEFKDIDHNASFLVEQSLCWYNSSDGNTTKGKFQNSGAYVFRPNSTTCFPVLASGKKAIHSVIKGQIVSEVRQLFSPWASQVFRLYKNAKDAELEFVIGPIPIEDNLGKEVISRFMTRIPSSKEFFTDSNGRDFLKRVRNHRADWNSVVHEAIAGNYYPLNLGIYLKDNMTEFSLLVDRAVGGSSIFDGELEVMLHRRLLHDDNKGVAENLNETVCFNNNRTCEGLAIQGKIYLSIDSTNEASEWRRTKGQKIVQPLQMAFAAIPEKELYQIKNSRYSMMAPGYELPPNIAVISLQELEDGKILLRLAHIYEVNENVKFSSPAYVDLQKIFHDHKMKSVMELNLSGVKSKSEVQRLDWLVEGGKDLSRPSTKRERAYNASHMIELMPMEIRTFALSLER